MSESNICLLKPEILCSLILIQSSLTNIIYPARSRAYWAVNQGSVVYMPVNKKLNKKHLAEIGTAKNA